MNYMRRRHAVDFELPDTQGKMHRLDHYLGSPLLLVFHRHFG